MKLEYWIIGVMIFLVAGVLGLIAASPENVSVPKAAQTSLEITETISITESTISTIPEPIAEPASSEMVEKMIELPTLVEVIVPEGSGVPGCDETNECFIPYEASIAVGGKVVWNNEDTAAHTVTSGIVSDGPDGVFDSGLFVAGTTFEYAFEQAGTYDYFCIVHPWMTGLVQVS